MDGNRAEVGEACFGANRRVLWNLDCDLVALVLIGERFDIRERNGDSASGMLLVIAGAGLLLFHSRIIKVNNAR